MSVYSAPESSKSCMKSPRRRFPSDDIRTQFWFSVLYRSSFTTFSCQYAESWLYSISYSSLSPLSSTLSAAISNCSWKVRHSLAVRFLPLFCSTTLRHSSRACAEKSFPKSLSIIAINPLTDKRGLSSCSRCNCRAVAGSKQVLKIDKICCSPMDGKVDLISFEYSPH